MIVKLLTEHHLEFLNLTGGYTGSSESTLVKTPHCWIHVAAHMYIDCLLYSKTCLKQPLRQEDQLSLNASQKYCRMLQGEHSAILSTFIKLQFVIKIFVLSFLSGC